MRILVVDDNQSVLDQVSAMLAQHQCMVETSLNGLDAYEKAQKSHFDLFIIDHLMPLMDGLTLSRNLKDNDATMRAPIIFMTTAGQNVIKSLPEHTLFEEILDKPLSEQHFNESVNTLLSQNTLLQSL